MQLCFPISVPLLSHRALLSNARPCQPTSVKFDRGDLASMILVLPSLCLGEKKVSCFCYKPLVRCICCAEGCDATAPVRKELSLELVPDGTAELYCLGVKTLGGAFAPLFLVSYKSQRKRVDSSDRVPVSCSVAPLWSDCSAPGCSCL